MTDKEKLHKILSSLWKNDDSVGKTYYNQALQDVQTAIDLQEEPVSEDLEEASRNYADNEEYGDDVYFSIKASFKTGAKWQKQQDQSTIELAEDHAMLAGMEKMKEEMMARAIDGDCFSYKNGYIHISCDIDERITDIKLGDKVKVIVIKED